MSQLTLNSIKSSDEVLPKLFNGVMLSQKLKKLWILEATPMTIQYLFNSLKTNSTIEYLNLSSNKLTKNDVNHILDGLKVNTGLKELVLSNNNLSIGDFTLILKTIIDNPNSKIKKFLFSDKECTRTSATDDELIDFYKLAFLAKNDIAISFDWLNPTETSKLSLETN